MITIDPQTRIGHVHLKVSDLERSISFYRDVLGFTVQQRLSNSAVFLSAGGYHHHIGLNTWESLGGSSPEKGRTGLFHFAILVPNRKGLAAALRGLLNSGVTLDGAADHGVSEAIYFRDPDNNGIEVYWDRPESDWPRDAGGELRIVTEHLDLDALLLED